jgi:transposase-like protein
VPRQSVLSTHPKRDAILAAVKGGRALSAIATEYGVTDSSIRRYISSIGVTPADESVRLAEMFRDLRLDMAYDLLPRWRLYSLAERLALVQAALLMMLQRALEAGAPHVVLQASNALSKSLETEVRFRGTQTPDESLADAERGQSVLMQRLIARLRERPELAEELLHDLSIGAGDLADAVVYERDGARRDAGAEAAPHGAWEESVDALLAPEREDVDGVDGRG